jgi:anaerobic selenocysteine-containing dehydrogenase
MEVIDEEGQCVHLPEQLRSGTPYPIKALIGFGLNHRMWPDSKGVLDSFENLEFFVNVDLFMTDSCTFADIVLPACSSLERSELRCWPMGYVTFTQPAIEPLYESRSDADIIYQIAQRLQLDDSLFQSGYEASLDWILAPSGMTVAELKQHPSGMFVRNPLQPPEKNYLNVGFPTPSGKMEFLSKVMAKHKTSHGLDPLPAYIPPKYSLEGSPQLAKEYPFILNTGSRLPMYVHSRTYRLSWINNLRPDCPALDMNPQDALRLRIGQGDTVRIHTPKDSIVVRANLTQMVMPGVIHMYHGNAAADVNRLIEGDYLDPVSGFPGYKALLCRLEKIS